MRQGKQGGTGLSEAQHQFIDNFQLAQFKTPHKIGCATAIYPIYVAKSSSDQNRDTKGELVQKWDNLQLI